MKLSNLRQYKITLYGDPRTKKNNGRIVIPKNGKRPFLLPSKQYETYEQEVTEQLPELETPIDYPVEIQCIYYMKTRRKVDLTNLLEATDDILVNCQILKDDNCRIIQSHDGSRVYHDKENPRVEITIRELDEYDESMMT